MNQFEYCDRVNGLPWVNRAEGPNAYDCWGLVLDSFRQVDNLELPQISGYADHNVSTEDAADGAQNMRCFKPCKPQDGAIMALFNTKGQITHVGRCLAGRVLHATSGLGVVWETYPAITKRYGKLVQYFQFLPDRA
ncbi:hypothetical protein [Vibrio phage LP.1]|nr:hypothetical protein [Vibrio phage LP.1]